MPRFLRRGQGLRIPSGAVRRGCCAVLRGWRRLRCIRSLLERGHGGLFSRAGREVRAAWSRRRTPSWPCRRPRPLCPPVPKGPPRATGARKSGLRIARTGRSGRPSAVVSGRAALRKSESPKGAPDGLGHTVVRLAAAAIIGRPWALGGDAAQRKRPGDSFFFMPQNHHRPYVTYL